MTDAETDTLHRCADCGRFHRAGACRLRPARPEPQREDHAQWKRRWSAMSDDERSERFLAELCASRNIQGDVDRMLASKAVAALAENKVADFLKLLDQLPPRVAVVDGRPTESAESAKAAVMQLIAAAQEADRIEQEPEIERLRAENARLRKLLAVPVPQGGASSSGDYAGRIRQ
jgi:hypothetical protein